MMRALQYLKLQEFLKKKCNNKKTQHARWCTLSKFFIGILSEFAEGNLRQHRYKSYFLLIIRASLLLLHHTAAALPTDLHAFCFYINSVSTC